MEPPKKQGKPTEAVHEEDIRPCMLAATQKFTTPNHKTIRYPVLSFTSVNGIGSQKESRGVVRNSYYRVRES
jgi:hypothetical protein